MCIGPNQWRDPVSSRAEPRWSIEEPQRNVHSHSVKGIQESWNHKVREAMPIRKQAQKLCQPTEEHLTLNIWQARANANAALQEALTYWCKRCKWEPLCWQESPRHRLPCWFRFTRDRIKIWTTQCGRMWYRLKDDWSCSEQSSKSCQQHRVYLCYQESLEWPESIWGCWSREQCDAHWGGEGEGVKD